MQVIEQSVEWLESPMTNPWDAIERAARTSYLSAPKGNSLEFVLDRMKQGHYPVLEFADFSFRIVTDRGVSHELVRHRIASYVQESSRFCNYSSDRFGQSITYVRPVFWSVTSPQYDAWLDAMKIAESTYMWMLNNGCKAQEARTVLPNSLKTTVAMKMNLRSLLNFLELRTGANAHPQMRDIADCVLRLMLGIQGFSEAWNAWRKR